jgi:hypothetical protein
MMTRESCEQLAMMARFLPNDGAQATSRTQSVWPSSFASSIHLKIHFSSDFGTAKPKNFQHNKNNKSKFGKLE